MSDLDEIVAEAEQQIEQCGEDPRMAVAMAAGGSDLDVDARQTVLDRVTGDGGDGDGDGEDEDEEGQQSLKDMTDGGPDINGDLLEDLEDLLKDHVGKVDAITAGEIADELQIQDSDGYPRTRDAIRVLLEERQFPVIAGGNGYYVPESRQQVEEEIESLESRAKSIQQREQLILSAWEARGPVLRGEAR